MRNLHTPRSSTKDPPTTASSTARMPYDRNNPAAASTSSSRTQPQPPTLARRTPVVPKLAAKPTPPPASHRQTVTLATPVPRRAAARSESALSGHASSLSHGHNYASPVGKLAAHNVTPRSGSRQSRLSSSNTSPSPADSAVDSWDNRSGLSISASNSDAPRSTPAVKQRDSKFFYASDASKGAQPPAPQRAPTSQPKGPTFFYANGNNLPSATSTPNVVSSPLLSPALAPLPPDPTASKFMYANGTPDLKPSLMNSGSGSAVSTSSRAPLVRSGNGAPVGAAVPRVPSPPKPASQPQSACPSIAERRSVLTSTSHLGGQNAPNLRRISAGADTPSKRPSGHSRSTSLVAAEPPPVNRIMVAATPTSISPLPSPLAFHNPGLSMASVLEAAGALEDHDDNESTLGSELTSPKSATGSGNDPLNELVANARRERKVQDLQITNASLEAINRTLERQLRKQTNELRRFKRLSRAGRLSGANTAAPSRIPSGSTTISETPEGPLNQLDLSDLSEEDSDPDRLDDDEDPESDELSESDSTGSDRGASPITMASRDVRHRRQDEKRLQVDLSKHRQLLVDSQKMNQSIKRCMGWTEELISEGRRALAYQVRVSEVEVGGRVAPERGEKPYIYDGAALWEHQDEDQASGSTSDAGEGTDSDDEFGDGDADETMRFRIERLRPVDESSGHKNAQDRDSGIVLSGDTA